LENKVKYGQHNISAARQLFGEEDAFLWLTRGDLKGETENGITAAPDKALRTKCRATKILRTETDKICSLFQQFNATVNKIHHRAQYRQTNNT
jgi:hypothetical protein